MDRRDPFGWLGSVIEGQFAVEAIAGEGAFGIVYRGTHLGFEAPVAIKCLKLPADLRADQRQAFLAKFRAEARLLHRLSRRTTGIVQALDVGVATSPTGAWTPYTVMEWLEGETLEEELRKRRAAGVAPRTLTEAIALLKPAAAALAIAHEENVSHRDIKPANMFLASSRGGPMLKVLDFGIAKVFAETPTLTEALAQTDKSFHAFTPQYGAPEQFSPRYGATGPWTDVYAMALTLIEVASGRPALAGGDVVQLFVATADEANRPVPSARGVDAPPAVEAVLARALAVSPAARYEALGEFWAALEAAALGVDATLVAASAPPRIPATPIPASGSANAPAARSAPATTGRTAGENRVCTVMFVDFSGMTQLSARLAPEEVRDLIDRCFQVVTESVERMGGVAEKPMGDRLMAVFGIPRATDNDAERAVHAALRIQEQVARLPMPRAARAARTSLRVGVETGRVFAGPVGTRQEFTVVGDAVNVAARLQLSAPAGAVVVGRSMVRQIARSFALEPVPGSDGSFRVLGLVGTQALSSSEFYGIETRLCGRTAERHALLEAVEAAIGDARAGLTTVVGAPGVGRSRLLAELVGSLAVRSEVYLAMTAQCSPLTRDQSYGLIASIIRRWFRIHDDDSLETTRGKLAFGVQWFRHGAEAAVPEGGLLPPAPEQTDTETTSWGDDDGAGSDREIDAAELDDCLDRIAAVVTGRESPAADSLLPNESAAGARPRVVGAVSTLLSMVAARVPIVIVCDDVQWADDASLDLLDELVPRLSEMPVLVVCGARPELYERRPLWGEGAAWHERIDLGPLTRRQIEEMIRDRLQRVPDLSAELVRMLAERAEGNPLTLVESLHLLVDAGVIEPHPRAPWVVHTERLGALALPATVQGIVQARLDRLEVDARGLLARATVVGKTFWQGALDALVDRWRADAAHEEAAPAPSAPTGDLLAQLRARQLVRLRESSTFDGEREYVFAESAIQEVAYEMLSLKVRRPAHLAVAKWLEQRGAGAALAPQLALHFERGGDLRRAASEYARAGRHAATLGQNQDAMRHFDRARQIHDGATGESELGMEPTPSPDGPASVRVASWRERVAVRLELGDVLRRVGRLDDAEQAYEQGRARILRGERRTGADLERHEIDRWEARVDFRLALLLKVQGRAEVARQSVQRAIERAEQGGAADETPAMYALLAFLHRRERDPEASWAAALRGLRASRRSHRRDERWREDVGELLLGLGAALYARGRMVAAERTYRQAARVLGASDSASDSLQLLGVALNGVAAVRLARGDLAGAREIVRRSLRLKERGGDLHQIAVACANLADVELKMGHAAAALELARRSVRLGEQARAGSDLPAMYHNVAEAALATGEIPVALDAAEKALGLAEVAGRVYLGDIAMTMARACVEASRRPELGGRAANAATRLATSLAQHFDAPDLRERAAQCRAVLEEVGGRS